MEKNIYKFSIGIIHITILASEIGTIIYANNQPIAKLNDQQMDVLTAAIEGLKQMSEVDFKEFISKGKNGKYKLVFKDQNDNTFEKDIIITNDMVMI